MGRKDDYYTKQQIIEQFETTKEFQDWFDQLDDDCLYSVGLCDDFPIGEPLWDCHGNEVVNVPGTYALYEEGGDNVGFVLKKESGGHE